MIGTSLWDYIFIRTCILFLHFIAPLSALYCVLVLIAQPARYRIPWPLEVWAVAETLFFVLIYLPRFYLLQHAAQHPPTRSREKRRELFELCHKSVRDPERYLAKWFTGAPKSEIRRENVKEFFCWAFLDKHTCGLLEDEELEEYAGKMEKLLGRKLPLGRGKAVPLRLTMDKVRMLHRSILWYLVRPLYEMSWIPGTLRKFMRDIELLTSREQCVSVVDTITFLSMSFHSFSFYRIPLKRFFTVFPFRPVSLLTAHKSPARTLSYWHRSHTSKAKLPVLFIHGIGIGLYPYVNFLSRINQANKANGEDGEVGIIAIEVMPISFRITNAMLEKDQMCSEILQILLKHGWDQVVLVSHSYGSIISTHLLHNEATMSFIGPTLLIDPVSFLLHLPDVAYNFTYRKPKRANEHQLYYFASMDMGIAHTLSRRFFWSENILWRHEIGNRPITVSLCGKDLIVDTETVGRYLAGSDDGHSTESQVWKHQEWSGEGLDLIWFHDLDHAQVFDKKRDYQALIDVIREYSGMKGNAGPNGTS